MSTINSVIGTLHGPSDPASQSFTRAKMGDMYVNPADIEPARYHVHLFTISKREFTVQQPPAIPHLVIPACGPDEEWKKVISIPHPFLQIERHPDKNEAIIYREVGERVAQSLCNPDNPTLDQDYVVKQPLGWGVNLNAQGVFWSLNETPSKEEIAKAHQRREKYYGSLIERSRTLEIANPKELEALINQDFHMAADYFGIETNWHKRLVSKVECQNCGEPLKRSGLAYHINAAGDYCVIDAERAAAVLPQRASRAGEESEAGPESPRRGRQPRV